MNEKYFMHRIKRANGTFDKGIEIHDTLESALGSFHAYLGVHAYGRNPDNDYVACKVTTMSGGVYSEDTWIRSVEPVAE